MENQYKPISCELLDFIEVWATEKRRGEIVFISPEGTRNSLTAGITTWISQNGFEYLVPDSGEQIRLDHLISEFGVPFHRGGENSSVC